MKSLILLLAVVDSVFACELLSAQASGQQPNILRVFTDDQRVDSIAAFKRIRHGSSDSGLGHLL